MRYINLLIIVQIIICGGCIETSRQRDKSITSRFVIGAFHGPPSEQFTDANFQDIKDAGIELLIFWNNYAYEDNLAMLDMAAKFDMKVIAVHPELYEMLTNPDMPLQQGPVKEMIRRFGGHEALAGYGLMDEPDAKFFDRIRVIKDWFDSYDPSVPIYVNLFPGYATNEQLGTEANEQTGTSAYYEYVSRFVETVGPDILCYDHYPYWEQNVVTPNWHSDLAVHRQVSRAAGIPFWMFIQSEGIRGGLRVPDQQEVYWQGFEALAYGARGLLWFTYWNPPLPPSDLPADANPVAREEHYNAMVDREGNKTQMYYYVKNANARLSKFGSAVFGWDNRYIARYRDGELIEGSSEGPVDISGQGFDLLVGTFVKNGRARAVIVNDDIQGDVKFELDTDNVIFAHSCKLDVSGSRCEYVLGRGGAVLIEY